MVEVSRCTPGSAASFSSRSAWYAARLSRDHELIYSPIQEFWDAAVSGIS
jgi:hypothetical protein